MAGSSRIASNGSGQCFTTAASGFVNLYMGTLIRRRAGWGKASRGIEIGRFPPRSFAVVLFGLLSGFFLLQAVFVFSDERAELRIVVLFAVQWVVKRAFRMFF
jgi:hypothetical protein